MSLARIVSLTAGVTVVFASTLWVQGCSSSSNSSAAQDSGTSQPMDSAVNTDTGSSADSEAADSGTAPSDSGAAGDGDAACEKPPKLFPESVAGVYCPFSTGNITCAAGQHCCETPTSAGTPSTCVANGTPCPVAGSVDWQCQEAIDCAGADAGGPICCGSGTPTTATHCGNTWPEWSSFTGTQCVTSCPAPGITVCEQNSDCTTDAGTTCTASKASGNDFGFCGP